MNLLKEIELVTNVSMEMKIGICEKAKGPSDLEPMLHFKYENSNNYNGVMLGSGNPLDKIPFVWNQIIKNGPIEFIMLITEAYGKTSEKIPEDYQHGQMEKEFKNDLTTDVFELINVHGIDIKTGVQASGCVAFSYNDFGKPVFDTPHYGVCEDTYANIPRLFAWCRNKFKGV